MSYSRGMTHGSSGRSAAASGATATLGVPATSGVSAASAASGAFSLSMSSILFQASDSLPKMGWAGLFNQAAICTRERTHLRALIVSSPSLVDEAQQEEH